MAIRLTQAKANRKNRTRTKIKARNRSGRQRIFVHVSNKYIYAQLIDDNSGKTLVTVSTSMLSPTSKSVKNKDFAVKLADLFAEKIPQDIEKKFVFDRGERLFHGRIKAFADALREKGFQF